MPNLPLAFSIFFSLFLLTHARVAFKVPHDLFSGNTPASTSPEYDNQKVLFLPSENTAGSDHISTAGLHVINRHARPLWSRLRHNCRHHPHLRGPHFVSAYGNDMLRTNSVDEVPRISFRYFGQPRRFPATDFVFPVESRDIPLRPSRLPVGVHFISAGDSVPISTASAEVTKEPTIQPDFAGEPEKNMETGFKKWVKNFVNRF